MHPFLEGLLRPYARARDFALNPKAQSVKPQALNPTAENTLNSRDTLNPKALNTLNTLNTLNILNPKPLQDPISALREQRRAAIRAKAVGCWIRFLKGTPGGPSEGIQGCWGDFFSGSKGGLGAYGLEAWEEGSTRLGFGV